MMGELHHFFYEIERNFNENTSVTSIEQENKIKLMNLKKCSTSIPIAFMDNLIYNSTVTFLR